MDFTFPQSRGSTRNQSLLTCGCLNCWHCNTPTWASAVWLSSYTAQTARNPKSHHKTYSDTSLMKGLGDKVSQFKMFMLSTCTILKSTKNVFKKWSGQDICRLNCFFYNVFRLPTITPPPTPVRASPAHWVGVRVHVYYWARQKGILLCYDFTIII